MADPLSLLRQYTLNKKEIAEQNEQIVFGEFAWDKDVKTNYIIFDTNVDGGHKEYYTLECVLFLLRNVHLPHPVYVRQAASKKVPVVTRADRKDLLAYLNGEIQSSASIDKMAPLVLPRETKRVMEEPAEDESKKPKLEEEQVLKDKERLAARLESRGDQTLTTSQSVRQIGSLSADEILRIRTKMLIKKQGTIKGVEDVVSEATEKRAFVSSEINVTKDIMSKERPQRDRTSILMCQTKDFGSNVFAILQSVKAKDEGKPHHIAEPIVANRHPISKSSGPSYGYNRFRQEEFKSTGIGSEFNIDTTRSYFGRTLKSVTESEKKEQQQQQHQARSAVSPGRPPSKGRVSRRPIIVIPSVMTSLITMYNSKDLLQDYRFLTTDVKRSEGCKREAEIMIQRKKEGSTTVPYLVVDNVSKFDIDDWERVVAVFVQGPAWQFKDWRPWHGNPVEIFDKVKAFHLKYDESALDSNIAGWAVEVLQLSKTKRHLDRPLMLKFWNDLDKYCVKWKPQLRT